VMGMDHPFIDEQEIVAQYAMRKLSGATQLEFEEHLVGCQICQDELETTDAFRDGLKAVASDPSGQRLLGNRPRWLANPLRPALAAAAALLVVAATVAVVFVRESRVANADLQQARRSVEALRRQLDQERQTRIDAERAAGRAKSPADRPSDAPTSLVTVFALNAVRGAGLPNSSAPPNQIEISGQSPSVVLSLDVDADADARRYTAVLRDRDGRGVWQAALSPVGTAGTLGVIVPSAVFKAGDYTLELQGLSEQGRPVLSRTYRFRVTIAR
jgi:hypothetical protein